MPGRPRSLVTSATAPVAAAALLLGALSGCADTGSAAGADDAKPVHGGTLNVVRSNPFEGFDLDKQSLNSSYQISQAVIEPLIRTDDRGTGLAPGLARSWTFGPGHTSLTFKLQPRAEFSDGTPVTPQDVAFSVRTWKSGASYGASYSSIKSTTILDGRTIRFNLAYPDTGLPAFLSWAAAGVMPADFGGRTAQAYYQDPIGAGPFMVEKWSANGEVDLKANPHYYRSGRPYVDEVVSSYASDPNSITLQVKSGEIDMADEIFPVTAMALGEDNVDAAQQHLTPVLLMNTKDPALSDVDVRRAIGYAIDYEGIAESALRGYGVVPTGPLPTNSKNWAPPSKPYFSHDVDRAEQLLAEADDAPTSLDLIYSNDPSSTLMAQVIQQDLDDVGITVHLQSADSATAFGAESSGEYQLGIFSYNAISPDVSDPAWYVAATSTMFTGFPVRKAVADLTGYATTTDTATKKAAVTRLQDLWSEQVPFLALAHTSALEAIRPVVHGAHVTPWGTYYLDTVWKAD